MAQVQKLSLRLHRQNQMQNSDFNFVIEEDLSLQGITFLFGPSGSGKTTLLRCIAGLEDMPGGRVQFNDEQWQNAHQITPVHRRAIGYVFQEPSLFSHLNISDNIQYGLQRLEKKDRKINLQDVVNWLGLAPLLHRSSDELSLGQKQRVAIGRALLRSPKLLLMDEPLASLDRQAKQDIMPYFKILQRQLDLPIIYVSHAMEEVSSLADQLILIDHGHITAHGSVNSIMTDPQLPLAQQDDAAAILQGEVIRHDAHYALTQVRVPGGELTVAQRDISPGRQLKIKLLAKDISLALETPDKLSISNALKAQVTNLSDSPEPSQCIVQLALADAPNSEKILARITKRSRDLLKLEIGSTVYALVKSASIMA